LDIDYNVAFIENAPIDALIQRFGRVNRTGKLKEINGNACLAPIYLFQNVIGRTPFYDDDVLFNTWTNLLFYNNKSLSENDLVEVCNYVYKNGYSASQETDFKRGLNNTVINEFEDNWIAGHWNEWIEDAIESNTKKLDVLCGNLVEMYDSLIFEYRYIELRNCLFRCIIMKF